GRLAVQQHLDVGAVIGEAVLVIADVVHHAARDLGDHLAIDYGMIAVFREQRRLTPTLAGDDDLVGGAERLAAEPRVHQAVVGDAELDVVLDESVEDRVRDLVADLVGMTLGNRFAGEQIVRVRHLESLPSQDQPQSRAAIVALFGPRPDASSSLGRVLAASPDRVRMWAKRWDAGEGGDGRCLFASPAPSSSAQSSSSPAISSTRSTMRRRSFGSLIRMKALVSESPSEVARKSET